MFKGKVLLFSLVLLFATSVYAGDVDECESECWITPNPIRVAVCPLGDFEFIRDTAPDAAIWVIIRDASGNGIPGIPWTDYWIQACDPAQELFLCAQPILSDSMTSNRAGVEGRTTLSGRIAGGGCVQSGGVYIAVQGKVIRAKPSCVDPICLDIVVVSPDINADGVVDPSDLSFFAQSYNKYFPDPLYNRCGDYNHDSGVDLSDFSFFNSHYRHDCGY